MAAMQCGAPADVANAPSSRQEKHKGVGEGPRGGGGQRPERDLDESDSVSSALHISGIARSPRAMAPRTVASSPAAALPQAPSLTDKISSVAGTNYGVQ
jgi:hypothetical protein